MQQENRHVSEVTVTLHFGFEKTQCDEHNAISTPEI
jgi:hypothetical protein